jgi:hypothetical protein
MEYVVLGSERLWINWLVRGPIHRACGKRSGTPDARVRSADGCHERDVRVSDEFVRTTDEDVRAPDTISVTPTVT